MTIYQDRSYRVAILNWTAKWSGCVKTPHQLISKFWCLSLYFLRLRVAMLCLYQKVRKLKGYSRASKPEADHT